ncbi:MAG: hypothetical protein ACM3XR_03685 [Bacillota bacterium]
MPKLLLAAFNDKSTGGFIDSIARSGILKSRVGYFLFNIFYKKWLFGRIRSVDTVSGTDILLLGLPIPLSYLRLINPICLERSILRICRENECAGYFVPMGAKKEGCFGTSTDTRGIRSIAFRSLLLPMLEKIYAGSGARLDNIDIVFAHEGDHALVTALIGQIEPQVKFIRVAAKDARDMEAQLSDICDETGIAVQVDSDYKKALRGADLVICTGSANGLRGCRVDANTIVIDYSDGGLAGLRGDFQHIKGIAYDFPKGLYSRLGEDVARSYEKSELTDILMMLKTGLIPGRQSGGDAMEKVSAVFKAEGCRIKGFIGRRGTIVKFRAG